MNNLILIFFPGKHFSDKYSHVGNCWPDVPSTWVKEVEKCVIEIEKLMWPQCIPFWLKRLIHYLATGNSAFGVKNTFFDLIRHYLTGNAIITSIQEKYGTLRFNGMFTDQMDLFIKNAEIVCNKTCPYCGNNCVRKVTSNMLKHLVNRYYNASFQCERLMVGLRLKIK